MHDYPPTPEPVPLLQLASDAESIFPARTVDLAEIIVFSNASPKLIQSWRPAYRERVAQAEEISIVRLPNGAMVSGRTGFATWSEGRLVLEQLTPNDPVAYSALMEEFANEGDAIEVSEETVLIARYGEGTWGHWLVELLPKIAVSERYAPGRFRYAMPDWVLQGGAMRERVLESAASYGVSEDRFVRMRSDSVYRFSELYAITPVYTDHVPHPDVAQILQTDIRSVPPHEANLAKVALLRSDTRRSIHNLTEVTDVLRRHRFTLLDIGSQNFSHQVRIFRSARTLFSVLGSGLSGLIYSSTGTRIIAAAPDRFGDRFFYGIQQTKVGSAWAEVRGPVITEDMRHYRDSSFEIPTDVLEAAIAALGV